MPRSSAKASLADLCLGFVRGIGAFAAGGVENEMSSRKDRAVSAGLGAFQALRPAGVSVSR